MKQRSVLYGIAIAAWVAALLYGTRFAMLDDALIHLRYASYLRQVHYITFDGVTPSFGTSSLLYVSLLALLRSLSTSPMLPKACSVVAYLAVLGLVIALFRHCRRSSEGRALSMALLLILITPMSIRWLTDGMETSLVVLAVALYAWGLYRQSHSSGIFSSLALVAGAVLLVLLRVELAMVVGIGCCAALFLRLAANRGKATRDALLALVPGLGALAAMLFVLLVFGHILPDTAAAKYTGARLGTALGIAKAVTASLLLGLGSLALYVLSAWTWLQKLRQSRSSIVSWALMNSPFPLLVLLSSLRGQAIHGVRYVLWALVFSIVFNILEIAEQPSESISFSAAWVPFAKWAVIPLVLLLPLDWHFAWRAMSASTQSFERMQQSHLDQFRNLSLVSSDIGFISYFSGARVCDLEALVNGREMARLSPLERMRHCAEQHPDFVYLSSSQATDFNRFFHVADWEVCQTFELKNVGTQDTHYLAVPPQHAAQDCSSFGGSKGQLQTFFQPPSSLP